MSQNIIVSIIKFMISMTCNGDGDKTNTKIIIILGKIYVL